MYRIRFFIIERWNVLWIPLFGLSGGNYQRSNTASVAYEGGEKGSHLLSARPHTHLCFQRTFFSSFSDLGLTSSGWTLPSPTTPTTRIKFLFFSLSLVYCWVFTWSIKSVPFFFSIREINEKCIFAGKARESGMKLFISERRLKNAWKPISHEKFMK